MTVPATSGPATSPVRRPRHLAVREDRASVTATPAPTDPTFPDYPFFHAHDAEARRRHLHGRAGRRWGRHPGFPALDDGIHLPATAAVRRAQGSVGTGEVQPAGGLGVVALAAAALVTFVTWMIATYDPSGPVVAFLSLSWLIAYLAACMWLELMHGNAVALAPTLQQYPRTRWVWLGWFLPVGALWLPKRLLDDAMWTAARAARSHRVRWTGWWWTAFVLGAVLSLAAAVVTEVPAGLVPDALGDVAVLQAGLRVAAAVACSLALVLWLPIVRRLSIIADRLAGVGRSTLVR